MAANAEFSTTLDYEFIGGGSVTVTGQSANVLDYSFDSDIKVLIFAESSNNFIGFDFSGGIQLPIINASADLSFDFSVSSTVEFGVQRWATTNVRIEFEGTAEGFLPIKSSSDVSVPFISQSTATQFSLGVANTSFDFSVSSEVLNYSLQVVDRLGINSIEYVSDTSNEVMILNENNDVEIVSEGQNSLVILS